MKPLKSARLRRPSISLALLGRLAACVIPFGLLGAIVGLVVLPIRAEVGDLRAQWDIKGAGCARTTTPLDPPYHLRTAFSYVDAVYAYDRAGVYCADVPERTLLKAATHQACQFNNPRFIRVQTASETVTFDIPPVQHATTFVRDGKVSCVLAGWFG